MSAAAGPTFFNEMKKGEIAELKTQLRTAALDTKEPAKLRAVIQKVIAYMTLGIDVSALFSEMIMVTNTRDLVQKKLVYLYLCNYAESNADVSLLAVNTLQKDCRDDNPMVRGLALRSICSLRLANIVEYILPFITRGLQDPSSYVRKTAVIGCAKLYRVSPKHVFDTDIQIIDKLYTMIRDTDPQVAVNAISTLNEILESEGGLAINQTMALHLLGRLKEFNEWGQAIILKVISKYEPTEQEVFDILNLLDEKLKHANSAVVLAVAGLLFKITENMDAIYLQVFERVKTPLVTLMEGSESHELSYAVLQHIHLMTQKIRSITGGQNVLFGDEYKHFLCLYNEPLYLKQLKLKVLTDIVTTPNAREIIAELKEQVSGGEIALAKQAMQAIGTIATRNPPIAPLVLTTIMELIDLDVEYISSACIVVLKDFLRTYPDLAPKAVDDVCGLVETIEDSEAKATLVWLLGTSGANIPNAPYLLEALVDKFDDESELVKMALLTSTMRLFFLRPPEMQTILGRVLAKATNLKENPDLHDRALLYYRLLQQDVNEAAKVVEVPADVISSFAEDESFELMERVFQEFNTLSVVYNKPAETFIKVKAEKYERQIVIAQPQPQSVQYGGAVPAGISLKTPATLDAAQFQELWGAQEPSAGFEIEYPQAITEQQITSALGQYGVVRLAGGKVGDVIKLYLYAQEEASSAAELLLVEVIEIISTGHLTATVKSPAPADIVVQFAESLRDWLQQ